MAVQAEVLVSGCRRSDVDVLRAASGPDGPMFRVVPTLVRLAREAVERRPLAIVLGFGPRSLENLEVIPAIRAVAKKLPIIVVAGEDTLELERRARQEGVFYYLVHPIEGSEVEAVLRDVLRYGNEPGY